MNLVGRLFNRSKNGVELTAEGAELYNYIASSIETLNNAEALFSKYKKLEDGEIAIACGSTLANAILIKKIKKFVEKYPKIKINIINEKVTVGLKKLNEGVYDVIITSLPCDFDSERVELHKTDLMEECFFTSKEYYESVMKKDKKLEHINNYMTVFPSKGTNYRAIIDKELKKSNMILGESNYEFSSAQSMVEFVETIGGIGIITVEYIKQKLKSGKLIKLYDEVKFEKTEVGIFTRNKKFVSRATNELIQILVEN